MTRFERVIRALVIEEDMNISDIIKAIETTVDESTQEKILEEV